MMRKRLSETNYRQSATFKKYQKLVGKLLIYRAWEGYRKDETGKEAEIYRDLLYMVSGVSPARYYRNRYNYSLTAVGDHGDLSEGAADLNKKLYRSIGKDKPYGWRYYNDGN